MTDRVKLKTRTSLSLFERAALVGTILIWVGVIVFGIGLYIAFVNNNANKSAYTQATRMAGTKTPTLTPSFTPVYYPVGWSTATPTPDVQATSTPEIQFDRSNLDEGPVMLVLTDTTRMPSATPTLRSKQQTTRVPRQPTPIPTLEPAEEPPEQIVIKAIDLDVPIISIGWHIVEQDGRRFSVWDVADYAAGWHKTSAYPGSNGNIVLSGHNNIRGQVFRYLIDVQVGERILLYADDRVYHYQVVEKHLLSEKGESLQVRRENAKWIAPTDDERLTLVTCWPYTGNSHRLVVVAFPVLPLQPGPLEEK